MTHTVRPAGPWEYFCRKVRLGGPDDCWEWRDAVTNGYGAWGHGAMSTAHRETYKLFNGAIPNGAWVLHRCNNKRCCNPDHLYAGTPKDNHDDRVKAGACRLKRTATVITGEKHYAALLTEQQVLEIRAAREAGVPGVELAKRYGVTPKHISKIHRRQIWRHLDQ